MIITGAGPIMGAMVLERDTKEIRKNRSHSIKIDPVKYPCTAQEASGYKWTDDPEPVPTYITDILGDTRRCINAAEESKAFNEIDCGDDGRNPDTSRN